MAAVSQGITHHVTLAVATEQASGTGAHDACVLQLQVQIIVYLPVIAIDTSRAFAQFLDELKVLGVHGAIDAQQTHTVHHVVGHFLLERACAGKTQFHHVAIGVGTGVTSIIALVATTAILRTGGHHCPRYQQQGQCPFQELSGFHILLLLVYRLQI